MLDRIISHRELNIAVLLFNGEFVCFEMSATFLELWQEVN